MTDEEIMKMAQEAGYDPESETLPPFDGFIRRFAEIVAEKTRCEHD